MDNELLTVEEMGSILKISRSKAYALARQKNFPSIKIGKNIRIDKKELFTWISKQASAI